MLLRVFAVACLLVGVAGCREEMLSQLSEQDANEIIAVLSEYDVQASKVAGADKSWQVDVERADFAAAIHILEEHGLPRVTYANIGELFKKEGLVSTPSEQRIRFIFAQQQALEDTVSRIDGVTAARVHIVLPDNDPLSDHVKPASASVFIKHRSDVDMTANIPAIKALVGHGIEGLAYENVSLSLFPSRGVTPLRNAANHRATANGRASLLSGFGGGAVAERSAWAVGGGVLASVLLILLSIGYRKGYARPSRLFGLFGSDRGDVTVPSSGQRQASRGTVPWSPHLDER